MSWGCTFSPDTLLTQTWNSVKAHKSRDVSLYLTHLWHNSSIESLNPAIKVDSTNPKNWGHILDILDSLHLCQGILRAGGYPSRTYRGWRDGSLPSNSWCDDSWQTCWSFFFVPLFVGEELLARSWKISSWTLKFDVPVPQRKSHASTQPRTYEKVYREAWNRTSQCNSTRICAVVQVPIALFIVVFGTNRLKTNLLNKNACAWASIFHGVWQVMLGGGHINADMQQFLENDKKVRPLAPFWRWSGDGLVQFWSYDTNMHIVSCIMVIHVYAYTKPIGYWYLGKSIQRVHP